jgi:hypothetical protein
MSVTVNAAAGENQAVHPFVKQQVDAGLFSLRDAVGIGQDDPVSSTLGYVFDTPGDLMKIGIADVGNHKPDGLRHTLAQSHCERIRPVAESPSRLEHALLGVLGNDIGVPVEDP